MGVTGQAPRANDLILILAPNDLSPAGFPRVARRATLSSSPGPHMTYSDFTLSDVTKRFALTLDEQTELFAAASDVTPSDLLRRIGRPSAGPRRRPSRT